MKKSSFKVFVVALIAFAQMSEAATHTWHAFESVLNGIELKNACLTADFVQTISSLNICEENKEIKVFDGINTSSDFVCVKWSAQNLSYPRKYTVEECVEISSHEGDMSCKKFKKKTYMLPQTITIRTWVENGENNNYPGFISKFTFPVCK